MQCPKEFLSIVNHCGYTTNIEATRLDVFCEEKGTHQISLAKATLRLIYGCIVNNREFDLLFKKYRAIPIVERSRQLNIATRVSQLYYTKFHYTYEQHNNNGIYSPIVWNAIISNLLNYSWVIKKDRLRPLFKMIYQAEMSIWRQHIVDKYSTPISPHDKTSNKVIMKLVSMLAKEKGMVYKNRASCGDILALFAFLLIPVATIEDMAAHYGLGALLSLDETKSELEELRALCRTNESQCAEFLDIVVELMQMTKN